MADQSMLESFQASYQRMEQALQRLVDSIAAYNPLPAASDELLAADDELGNHLETLVRHQDNVRRLEKLRRQADDNDTRARSTLQQIADLRKEVSTIPSTSASSDRATTVDEILSYARFISPTTVPPTFRKQDVQLKPIKTETADAHMANGVATPAADAQEEDNTRDVKAEEVGAKALRPEQAAWLDPLAGLPFEPWPSVDKIQAGALGEIQKMVEAGKDPASVLSPEEQTEADRRRAEEEERERLEELEREKRRASMFDVQRRRTAVDESDVFDPDA
ncbi:hypothetical protein KC340_g3401 [Hortaea werneckii]|nr:hypothetical protein KC342_g3738 [Hortaea werneckii]KAI7103044.1 hypothetical protein KC339_g5577 [Hortaea werneckii]KAI7244111.1 hypothetical protein KC365_g1724 [Hortaea werneckii]KAI7332357.1 hypothetical protein KC340_g3401 [Hortaea werneckii]KAI7378929.1 hypothetical protein KC328_g13630 [Hortaea werneckii]